MTSSGSQASLPWFGRPRMSVEPGPVSQASISGTTASEYQGAGRFQESGISPRPKVANVELASLRSSSALVGAASLGREHPVRVCVVAHVRARQGSVQPRQIRVQARDKTRELAEVSR